MANSVKKKLMYGVILAFLAQAYAISLPATAADIDRVEPPFWWKGFKDTALQLLVYGDNIGASTVAVDHPGITVTRVKRVENSDYLFVYLNIGDEAATGDFDIEFTNDRNTMSHAYRLLTKNPHPQHTNGFTSADAIYLITPDRFANGNPGNDDVAGFGDAVNRERLGGRHGGDIEGISNSLDYISDMGFTAIWLNPVLENAMPEYSYHGYATTDFYRVDPRYGSNESYRELVATARRKGMGVIMDMIVNHTGSEHWWMSNLPTSDWINSAGEYTQTTHARTTWQDPYASKFDLTEFADGWFVPTMPDINQRNPLMADYLIQNALWWIEYLGIAGIRMDTYPYPDKHFMTEWTRRVMHEYPNFNVVGEEWSLNPVVVSYWQKDKDNHDGYMSYLPSLMDFPLQNALSSTLVNTQIWDGSLWADLYKMLANDIVYPDPTRLVIFADNHDMSRIYTQLDEDYDLFRMAMVYLLTMRGTPQIYYGTEVLMSNRESDDHGLIRSDFPGGWPGDSKDAFSGDGLSTDEARAQQLLKTLLNWRKHKSVVHTGKLMQFTPFDGIYTYFRYDDSNSVMVIFNKSEEAATVETARFAERLQGFRSGVDVLTGAHIDISSAVTVPARSVLLLDLVR